MDLCMMIENQHEMMESVYDLAALCYDYLLQKIDNQIIFIGEYLTRTDDAKQNNPNYNNLLKFADKIKKLLFDTGYWNGKLLDKIITLLRSANTHLKPFGKDVYNEASLAYYLILGIDLYAEHFVENSESAPLNRAYQENSFIYRCRNRTILTEAAENIGFRKQIQTVEIRNRFHCLRILEKSEVPVGMNPPKMVTLYVDKEDTVRNDIIKEKTLSIASIPFGKEKICDFPRSAGGVFCVKYTEEHKKSGTEKALKLLNLAIKRKANVIIFPEYVCTPEMQEAIGAYLRDTYRKNPDTLKELFLVIAGSGWTKENNNVSAVFSYSGKLLGTHYKHAAYDNEHLNKDNKKEAWIEGLADPGKNSIIVDIPGIGSVMPAICRDISNRQYAEKIARAFRVDFLIVPAWSPSLHQAFEGQLQAIAETNTNTCAVVCNCCTALPDKPKRGLAVTPYQKSTRVIGKTRLFPFSRLDEKTCANCKGCIFSLQLSFQIQDVAAGKILRSCRRYTL